MSTTVVLVQKAARSRKPTHDVIAPTFGEPTTDVYRNIAGIGNRIVEGYAALVKPLDGDALHAALRSRNVDLIVAGLDWPALVTACNALVKPLTHTLQSFARLEVTPEARTRALRKALGTVTPKSVATTVPLDRKALPKLFTTIDQKAVGHAQGMAGKLITHITEDTRAQVREHVTTSLQGDLTVDQLARKLRTVIPLTPAQAASVEKLKATHLQNKIEEAAKKGLPASGALSRKWIDEAQKIADKAAASKLRARASNIARTEVVAASNQGRYLAWQGTVESGLAASNSRKEWIAAAGACPDCAALDGEQVLWDEPFSTGDDMPPNHPSCRCSAVMLPPDVADEDPVYAAGESQGDSTVSVAGDVLGTPDLGTTDGLRDQVEALLGDPDIAALVADSFKAPKAVEAVRTTAAVLDASAPRVFAGLDDMKAFGTSMGLPAGEAKKAVKEYTTGTSADMNRLLRGHKLSGTMSQKKVEGWIEQLDTAMSVTPEDIVVHRGVDIAAFGGKDPGKMVGRLLRDKGYLSTSMSNQVLAVARGTAVHIELTVPAGSRAVYAADASVKKVERELIIDRDSELAITSATYDERTRKWSVQATLVQKKKR